MKLSMGRNKKVYIFFGVVFFLERRETNIERVENFLAGVFLE